MKSRVLKVFPFYVANVYQEVCIHHLTQVLRVDVPLIGCCDLILCLVHHHLEELTELSPFKEARSVLYLTGVVGETGELECCSNFLRVR